MPPNHNSLGLQRRNKNTILEVLYRNFVLGLTEKPKLVSYSIYMKGKSKAKKLLGETNWSGILAITFYL
jgi:hypothetical protein